MKKYKSDEFKLFGEEVEIDYDEINNFVVECKDFLCIDNDCRLPVMSKKKIMTRFVADDEKGIGLCTSIYEEKDSYNENTAYYEDEEWAQVFASIEKLEYYDDFSKIEDIRAIISYNISEMNKNTDEYTIIDKLMDVKLRDANNNLVGVAKECYIEKSSRNDDSFVFVLNKIVTSSIDKMDLKKMSVSSIDGMEVVIWDSVTRSVDYYMDKKNGIVKCFTSPLWNNSTLVLSLISANRNEETIDYDYDDSYLDLTYKDIKEYVLQSKLVDSDFKREGAVNVFNKYYDNIFKKEIKIVKYLLG